MGEERKILRLNGPRDPGDSVTRRLPAGFQGATPRGAGEGRGGRGSREGGVDKNEGMVGGWERGGAPSTSPGGKHEPPLTSPAGLGQGVPA